MTKEKAIKIINDECENIKRRMDGYTFQSDNGKGKPDEFYIKLENLVMAFNMAVKVLEESSVLDKIRAEVKALSNANPSYWHSGDMVYREDVLGIIDKYKAESEE